MSGGSPLIPRCTGTTNVHLVHIKIPNWDEKGKRRKEHTKVTGPLQVRRTIVEQLERRSESIGGELSTRLPKEDPRQTERVSRGRQIHLTTMSTHKHWHWHWPKLRRWHWHMHPLWYWGSHYHVLRLWHWLGTGAGTGAGTGSNTGLKRIWH